MGEQLVQLQLKSPSSSPSPPWLRLDGLDSGDLSEVRQVHIPPFVGLILKSWTSTTFFVVHFPKKWLNLARVKKINFRRLCQRFVIFCFQISEEKKLFSIFSSLFMSGIFMTWMHIRYFLSIFSSKWENN